MRIVHLATEFAPIAKVGGLGDVVAGLSKAFKEAHHEIEVILPFYDQINRAHLDHLTIQMEDEKGTIFSANYQGIPLTLIALRKQGKTLPWKHIYPVEDPINRFCRFTQVALAFLLHQNKPVTILHLHDWLTALAAPLYDEYYRFQGLTIEGVVLTLHNMEHQGISFFKQLDSLNLPETLLSNRSKLADPTRPDCFNLLKSGLLYADYLTTVSPTYAKEILGEEGFKLESILHKKKDRLRGILNGIDTTYWDPVTDPFLVKNYRPHPDYLEDIRRAKEENRQGLHTFCKTQKKEVAFDRHIPLFASISRFTKQKGPQWIQQGLEWVLQQGGAFILLGSSFEPHLKKEFESLANKYRTHSRVYFHFSFDEPLAHLTYAAADCILIPSLFEPCGLTQMIAMRYGTLPIVHRVGGLRDTVFDIDDPTALSNQKNGYTFDSLCFEALKQCLNRVFINYYHERDKWEAMQKNGLTTDWSWKRPAQEYLAVYKTAIASKPA